MCILSDNESHMPHPTSSFGSLPVTTIGQTVTVLPALNSNNSSYLLLPCDAAILSKGRAKCGASKHSSPLPSEPFSVVPTSSRMAGL